MVVSHINDSIYVYIKRQIMLEHIVCLQKKEKVPGTCNSLRGFYMNLYNLSRPIEVNDNLLLTQSCYMLQILNIC